MNRQSIHRVLAAFIAASMLLLCACAAPSEQETTAPLGPEPTQTTGIPVENPFLTYRYPSELEEDFILRETNTEDRHQADFCAELSGRELVLFSVILGTEAEPSGFELGVLEDAFLGTIHVTLVMNEQQPEGWSEADYQRINALQERINDLITQFHEDPRFIANR